MFGIFEWAAVYFKGEAGRYKPEKENNSVTVHTLCVCVCV